MAAAAAKPEKVVIMMAAVWVAVSGVVFRPVVGEQEAEVVLDYSLGPSTEDPFYIGDPLLISCEYYISYECVNDIYADLNKDHPSLSYNCCYQAARMGESCFYGMVQRQLAVTDKKDLPRATKNRDLFWSTCSTKAAPSPSDPHPY